MEQQGFVQLVMIRMEAARDSLARIEAEAQRQDRPELHATSRLYAQFCMHAREFLSGSQRGRPLPRRLGKQVESILASLQEHEEVAAQLGLSPTISELVELVRAAETTA